MGVKIVLGHTFGDEGKGVTVQWLCKKAIEEGKKPLVVRFSGGPQAAHTIFNRGTEHICSSFGSGVLLGVPTMYTKDVFLDPICLMNEYKVLKSKGIDPKIFLAPCRIITPYDVIAGRNNYKVRTDGTCGKGLYPTFERYNNQEWKGRFFDTNRPKLMLKSVASYYNVDRMPEYDEMFQEACLEMMTDVFKNRPPLTDIDVLILEGSQGLLLDMDNGFYPHVTPSKVGLNGVPEDYLKDAEVYLVTRTYTTRHGNGYTPKSRLPYPLAYKHETNINNEFQGEFKTGLLEVDLLNRAYERHHIDNYIKKYNMSLNLVITHMDVVRDYNSFKFMANNREMVKLKLRGEKGYDGVANAIQAYLSYEPDHIYYNDSVESNIKQLK